MDRRRFLLTSLAGVAPAPLGIPAAAEAREPTPPVGLPPNAHTQAQIRWAANQLHFFVTPVVEVYSECLLREIDPADPLRHYLEHMLGVAEKLREVTQHLRMLAEDAHPAGPARD
jgi:hypothetical protein